MKAPDYSSSASRKQLIEKEFKRAAKILGELGRTHFFNDNRRRAALLETMDMAKGRFPDIRVYSLEESLVRFEIACLVNFHNMEDQYNYTLGSGLWILDQLRRNGKLHDAYDLLPESRSEIEEIFTPVDFYHPCYEDDLIQSVCHVVYPRNSHIQTREQFKKLCELLPQEKFEHAVETYKTLMWKALECFLRCEEYFDKASERRAQELRNIQNPSVLMIRQVNTEEREQELEDQRLADEDDRKMLTGRFEDHIGTVERKVYGRRELGKILSEFTILDPFEICFAATYIVSLHTEELFSVKAGIAVMSAAGRMLPWYESVQDWDEDKDPWEPMTFDWGIDWLEKTDVAADLEKYYRRGRDGKNLAQRVYSLCKGMMPIGFHPFEGERMGLKGKEDPNADLIADQAEILFLSAFHASAANFRGKHWWDDLDTFDEEENGEDAGEETDVGEEPVKLGGYWGKIAAEQGIAENTLIEGAGEPEEEPPAEDEKALLEKARQEIKSLKTALSTVSCEAEGDKAKYERELKALRMEHRELADLRELVFNQQADAPERREKVEKQYEYPYATKRRTVVFGGHDSFLRAIKPMLPDVRFVDASNMTYSPEIIRNADVVWIQNNCISHPQYWSIVKNCKLAGVQMRYFGFASAEKCAEQLVTEDMRPQH